MHKLIGICLAVGCAVAVLTACAADRREEPRSPAAPATAPVALDPAIVGDQPPGVTTEMVVTGP